MNKNVNKTKHKSWNGKIWFTRCPVGNASEIAISKGLLRNEFAKDGIEVNSIQTLPAKEWDIHFTHEHPQFFREGGNIPPIWARANGTDIKLIGLSFLEQKQSILVKKNSPIKSVKDLKGKRLAVPRRVNEKIDFWRATVKHGFITALEANGLDRQDVEFVDLPVTASYIDSSSYNESVFTPEKKNIFQKVETDALLRGDVDAIYSAGGRAIELGFNGAREILDLSKQLDPSLRVNNIYPNIITASGGFGKEHPEIVTKYLKVLIKAGRWAKENREEVLRIFAKGTYVSEEAFAKSHPQNFHNHVVPEISDRGLEALEVQKRFLKEEGFIKNDFNINSWVDRSFLEAALAE